MVVVGMQLPYLPLKSPRRLQSVPGSLERAKVEARSPQMVFQAGPLPVCGLFLSNDQNWDQLLPAQEEVEKTPN